MVGVSPIYVVQCITLSISLIDHDGFWIVLCQRLSFDKGDNCAKAKSLRRVDPVSQSLRTIVRVHRREYWVPGPNALWYVQYVHVMKYMSIDII